MLRRGALLTLVAIAFLWQALPRAAAPVTYRFTFPEPGHHWVQVEATVPDVDGTLQLQRQGTALSGTWTGTLGSDSPVTGTWRDGYVELSFPGEWPKDAGAGVPGPVTLTLAGWIDGDAGKGRGKVEAHADGQWTATKKPAS